MLEIPVCSVSTGEFAWYLKFKFKKNTYYYLTLLERNFPVSCKRDVHCKKGHHCFSVQ